MSIRKRIKNAFMKYSHAELKVREATCNDPKVDTPPESLMSEIAELASDPEAFAKIMKVLWKRLDDRGKLWLHVYKSLIVLEYLIKNGNDKVVQQCKERNNIFKTLNAFEYTEKGNDYGRRVQGQVLKLQKLLLDNSLKILNATLNLSRVLLDQERQDKQLRNERTRALGGNSGFAHSMICLGMPREDSLDEGIGIASRWGSRWDLNGKCILILH